MSGSSQRATSERARSRQRGPRPASPRARRRRLRLRVVTAENHVLVAAAGRRGERPRAHRVKPRDDDRAGLTSCARLGERELGPASTAGCPSRKTTGLATLTTIFPSSRSAISRDRRFDAARRDGEEDESASVQATEFGTSSPADSGSRADASPSASKRSAKPWPKSPLPPTIPITGRPPGRPCHVLPHSGVNHNDGPTRAPGELAPGRRGR